MSHKTLAFSIALLALSLTACTKKPNGDVTGSIRASDMKTETDWRNDIAKLTPLYERNPQERSVALAYGRALRNTGQTEQAVAVLQRAVVLTTQTDMELLGEYGRALADDRKYDQALDVLSRAHTPERPDWRIFNVQGAVHDQMGKPDEAQKLYALALKIAPNEPRILSNLGLSYALSGKLKEGEQVMRQAASTSNDARIRQNLALVIGLQGRFAEAETLVRQDSTPEQAEQNVMMLKSMLGNKQTKKRA